MFFTLRTAFDRTLTAFVIFLLGSLAVIVLMGVAYRKLGISMVWYDEVASIALAWLTYYGAALAALKRAHIGFPGLVNAMPPVFRVPIVLLGEAVVIAFFAVLAWYGYQVLVILEGDSMVSLPWVSTRLTQSVIPVGAVLFILAQLFSLPELLAQARGAGVVDAEKQEMEKEIQKALQQ
ncbi:MAG: TRAP transporter small permease [Hydrogenophaga sp.]|uniref:TRAP transporter small permease n=1 Tax=Hydrogenophaga sp. TaxID=1904254 RepID=UPI002718C422|nr:TRAP transporter small permease [Hydrogenophaga sp.]MDO8889381.1 TRAP transporter small permease [Hydrogenophaga sp.]MDO9135268.1 TRAP transporter small permease [Hydrogenophaga sp.]MDP1780866.1 TRAP transporter small permease [Hydrogenophaga sp.]MDP2075357.1 TRAP transporter small permease [Hydrogenophaga sp.]MDP3109139.1 TRAP transporter small permease [Hydrogenophaga sp.]